MPTCRNRNTGADVEVSLCNAASRPEPSVVQCNTHSCPPKYEIHLHIRTYYNIIISYM